MLRRVLLAGFCLAPLAARAQEQTPLGFLQSIYDPYKQSGFKGQPYWEARRFFVSDLADAMERDFAEARKRKEVPTLDGDPFIDAQDWRITSIGYAVSQGADKAGAVINLVNLGQPKILAVFLRKTSQGWRVDDIVGRGGSSLRALYKLK